VRELEEETGVLLRPSDLVKVAYELKFEDGSTKSWFAGLYDQHLPLRDTGTFQVIPRNGERIHMKVLGPPQWVLFEELLFLPPKGYCAENRRYLHYSHEKGLVETVLYLRGLALDSRHRGLRTLWTTFGPRISELRRRLNPEVAA
jgi:8-oxo-dGTP pyrophosphatase MutT (NUDIX family)